MERLQVRAPCKEVMIVLKHASKLGFYVQRTNGHIILRHPEGHTYPVCGTPQNRTAFYKSAMRDLKKFKLDDYRSK